MASILHLLKRDSPAAAVPTIVAQCGDADARVTVVLLDPSVPAPALPAGASVRRLGADLDHSALLDLIFDHERVVAW